MGVVLRFNFVNRKTFMAPKGDVRKEELEMKRVADPHSRGDTGRIRRQVGGRKIIV